MRFKHRSAGLIAGFLAATGYNFAGFGDFPGLTAWKAGGFFLIALSLVLVLITVRRRTASPTLLMGVTAGILLGAGLCSVVMGWNRNFEAQKSGFILIACSLFILLLPSRDGDYPLHPDNS